MDLVTRIEQLIEAALKDLGYEIVEILLIGANRLKLEISIEKIDRTPVSIKDCVKASREISAILDVEDPISSAFVLEVSSPGINRPLVKRNDYKRFVGERVKLKTHEFVGQRKRFKGVLSIVDDTGITLALDDSEKMEDGSNTVVIEYDQIQRAKLDPEL